MTEPTKRTPQKRQQKPPATDGPALPVVAGVDDLIREAADETPKKKGN